MARKFSAGMSTTADAGLAVGEVVGTVLEQLGGVRPDLVLLFVSGAHTARMADFVSVVEETLDPGVLLAVSAVGVLGGGEEAEQGTAVSLWAGQTGPVEPVRLEALDERPDSDVIGLPDEVVPGSTLLLLADPFSFPVDGLIEQLPPDVAVVGGLASAASAPGGNRLWLGGSTRPNHALQTLSDGSFSDGAVGVLIPPGVVNVTVSQGCRPVGSPWVVTAGEGNLIFELGGQLAVDRLQDVIAAMSAADRIAGSRGLHIGLVANDQQETYGPGDFLIRTVFGIEQESQAVAIGAAVEVGQLVQFQVRDPDSATADLERLLSELGGRPEGALVFTCNGRGTHLFAEPHHDAALVSEFVAGGVAGMFCAGELGPIGNRNAVHGFSAAIVTFGQLR